jgi:hypothetical protein
LRPSESVERKESVQDDETEIIHQEQVADAESKRIKIKIKERISRRSRKKFPLVLKVGFLLLASLLGYRFGSKVVEKYIRYWFAPTLRYYSSRDQEYSQPPSAAPSQVYTIMEK